MGITGPNWLGWLFAVVMLGTAAYCAVRLVVAWRSRRPTGYAVDLTHILMGSAMAGMLVPSLFSTRRACEPGSSASAPSSCSGPTMSIPAR